MESPKNIDEIKADRIIKVFNQCFNQSYSTELTRGCDEPLYTPAGPGGGYHQVIFAHGFPSSALHEVSHWCIAGPERRLKEDYGYWYVPDGRSQDQQGLFEIVEVKPQALEWLYSVASGLDFRVSLDNLSGHQKSCDLFRLKVRDQSCRWIRGIDSLPLRSSIFLQGLWSEFHTRKHWEIFWQNIVETNTLPSY